MTREEARIIIEKEDLKGFNWNEERYYKENEVGIKLENNVWIVYATDERASVVSGSVKEFEFEEDALDNFIKRLRADKVLREL
ncbi:MAG: hypothetical protein K0S80_5211 [Neobacillus sp.]|jgi:hypothetical protein|nr:hypothetical protein [Neobacillus sp.]